MSSKKPVANVDLSSPAEAKRFQRAAAKYGKRAGKSKATAVAALKRIGILNKSGKLAKAYR